MATSAYRAEIDGLRAVAVLPVMLFHAGFVAFQGGFVGVDVFFVISGYLVTSLILAEGANFSLVRFYERRARRILPALVLVLATSLAVGWWWLLPADLVALSRSLVAVIGLGANIFFWNSALDYFAKATELWPLLHTWSLAVEEQFYLFFPLLLIVLRRAAPRSIGWTLAALGLFSLALAQWGSVHAPVAAFFMLPTRGWELLLGAWLAWRATTSARPLPGTSSQPAREILAVAGVVSIFFAVAFYSPAVRFPGLAALAPTVGTALVISYATPATLVGRVLGSRALVGVGLISYSAYLWHQPLLAFARTLDPAPPSVARLLGLLGSALVLAGLSWRFVEQPWRDRSRVSRRQVAAAAATAAFVLTAGSIVGIATRGAAFRYDAADRALLSAEITGPTYLFQRFDALRGAPFDPLDRRPKLLVIGDSYAADMVNALHEAGHAEHVQISTRRVPFGCGNLFLLFEAFHPLPANYNFADCTKTLMKHDHALRTRMREADSIWILALWQSWEIAHLPASLDAIRAVTGGRPLRVFGPKSLGPEPFQLRQLLGRSPAERARFTWSTSPSVERNNRALAALLPEDTFVDLQRELCGATAGVCHVFSAEGELLSFDGFHLTPAGARVVGDLIAPPTHERLRCPVDADAIKPCR